MCAHRMQIVPNVRPDDSGMGEIVNVSNYRFLENIVLPESLKCIK